MKIFCLLMLAASFHVPAVFAREVDETATRSVPAKDCEEAITVFQDVSRVGRKDRAASNITRRHADMAQHGWRFVDMEVYTENSDIEGFYLSYTRAVACADGPGSGG
jgi:hypothetical protein